MVRRLAFPAPLTCHMGQKSPSHLQLEGGGLLGGGIFHKRGPRSYASPTQAISPIT